ncbi:Bug family tripartite tricarboxylate transporter substrate binding protein [Ottowia thiooxydans]|uniref:Bug family tripartite tricarboxylate transporter substrate binding protein n=1 Tax=Ottowia thiooxydans TaxID=219182 RepID=UPI00041A9F15|nr:tripartite tricarboxylate transporter substrate binding protein [Ottowia thiooxydans]
MNRRKYLLGLCAPLLLPVLASAQQPYPQKPIRVVVGVAPGGAGDILGRLFAQRLSEGGQSLFVENKPGAAGTLAADFVAKAAPDGYTLLVAAPATMVVAPFLFKKLSFDPSRDFEPIGLLGGGPLVLVVPSELPVKSVTDLAALIQKAPAGSVAFGSGGQGTASHLTAEAWARAQGAKLIHSPYKGDGQALMDVLGGQVQFMFTGLNLVEPHIKSGRLRVLGVTSKSRLSAIPQIPTLDESGFKGFESLGWLGVYAPAKTPASIIQKLASDWETARKTPAVAGVLNAAGMGALTLKTPAEFASFQRSEITRWAAVIKAAGIEPE